MTRCEHCDLRLPVPHRADARYCSTRCRVAAHRAEVPAELRRHNRWVRWKLINPYGKPIKLPLRADDHRIWKAPPASSTDPTTWSSYAKANRSPVGHGLGFVLNGDGIICIDLDHCVVDGKLDADAAAFVKRFPKTYVEISPSGTGLHIWGFGTVIKGRKFMHGDLSVEIYGTGRYLTFTGTPFVKAPFADLSEGLIRLDR